MPEIDWEILKLWGENLTPISRLTGGVANNVWSVQIGGELAICRLGSRSDADLAWETDLLQKLNQHGIAAPVPIPTMDGALFARGMVLMTYVEGEAPANESDWRRVADLLREMHKLTQGWPQRPGWRSSIELVNVDNGTRIDLNAMPEEGVRRCRAAWSRFIGKATCVVHGDLNPGNIRITRERVALIDWDESHVDVPEIDLVLPHNAAGLDPDALDIASQASSAWQAAVCWDDDYSKRRLAEVRPL